MTTPKRLSAAEIIHLLDLHPLPQEGGLFRETYRSADSIPAAALPARYARADKTFCTDIYYLLGAGDCSLPHRLESDELYHFHLGDAVEMWLLHPDGRAERIVLGGDLAAGQRVQVVVPAGAWQTSRLCPGGEYALMSVVVAPGFDEADYEHGNAGELARQYPAAREFLASLL